MSQKISLKEAERKAFTAAYNDGMWDVFLGCFFLMFVIAPYLSESLGDFWSSVVFLPFWGMVYLAIWLVRKRVVSPRIGVVKFGPMRITKLTRLTGIMLVVNLLALILGFIVALNFISIPGQMIGIFLGLMFLIGFSTAAYFLDFNRLYLYGLLVGLSPLIGEWLWSRGYATHHGFPLTFGVASGIMILVGLVVFIRLVHHNPLPIEGFPPEEA